MKKRAKIMHAKGPLAEEGEMQPLCVSSTSSMCLLQERNRANICGIRWHLRPDDQKKLPVVKCWFYSLLRKDSVLPQIFIKKHEYLYFYQGTVWHKNPDTWFNSEEHIMLFAEDSSSENPGLLAYKSLQLQFFGIWCPLVDSVGTLFYYLPQISP